MFEGAVMSKVDPGKRFEAKLSASMENAGLHVMRIPDKVYWTGSRLVSEETPADFQCGYAQSYNGELHAILVEAKACSKHRIPFDRLKRHQHDALMEYEEMNRNSHGFVAVNFYDPVSLSALDVCFMVPIKVWDEHAAGDMKSLSHDDCLDDERVFLCPKMKGSMYDLSRLVKTTLGGLR